MCPGCQEEVSPVEARTETPLTVRLRKLPVPPARAIALQKHIQALVHGQLGRIPRVDEGLFAAGLDSKQLVALTAELSDQLGLDIPSTILLEHQDVKTLVAHFSLSLGLLARRSPGR